MSNGEKEITKKIANSEKEIKDDTVEKNIEKVRKKSSIDMSKSPKKFLEKFDTDMKLEMRKIFNEDGTLRIPLKTKKPFKKDDFEITSMSGKGSYGTVLKVKNIEDGKIYALKMIDTYALYKIEKLYQAYLECDILSELNSPYMVNGYGAFEDDGKIFMVMEYLSGGDFSDFLKLNYPLKNDSIQFYSAEIVNFLDYMQKNNVIHRDLKPENIMMDENFHLKVIDFGTARILGKVFDKIEMKFKEELIKETMTSEELQELKGIKEKINEDDDDDECEDLEEEEIVSHQPKKRGMTFVGTAEYVSPEVLMDNPACFGSDVWAFGIMLYQMYFGKTPFKDKNSFYIFKNIRDLKIDFPNNKIISPEAEDLIKKILVKEPNERLGSGEINSINDMEHLKLHPFFKGIDWDNLYKMVPPNKSDYEISFQKNKKEKSLSKKRASATSSNAKNVQINQDPKIIILKEGFLDKKSPWIHYNKRKMILDSTPKLIYVDPEKNEVKGEILLDKLSRINHINKDTFELITERRSYRFKGKNSESMIWEKEISDAIRKYAH